MAPAQSVEPFLWNSTFHNEPLYYQPYSPRGDLEGSLEMASVDLDFADVKPSVYSFVVITLTAVAGIALLKWAMQRWPVPGLSDLVNAV